ncbi:MAG: DsrE/DsrF/DrsH-like family protein [Oscillospiraceae bacterium]|nr:DsrE/DsrF/DrsH-like family protein [Oscillospiraceae bacterium]
MDEIKHISIEEFLKLDRSGLTLLDLREPDQVLLGAVEGAVNIPFSRAAKELDKLPKDKPVYVFCQEGSLSTEITELLQDWDYDATNLDGGWRAWQKWLQEAQPQKLDAKGLKCPGPIVKTADTLRAMTNGQRLLIEATEDAFASDIAVWCQRTGNKLLKLEVGPERIEALVEKAEAPAPALTAAQNDKTFVVFSGDLDKTIAAFIMANGAAAMGRKVTMFFTFWGLNILRRPEKVSVIKSFIERMFGLMMPRGTKKLGLSRMNMGGLGAKMIRAIMKEKGVSSLEELIDSAREHGVRLVACQMSMDIMGIKKEELIDGVELGGVSTFLGSGEQSDMSLFI